MDLKINGDLVLQLAQKEQQSEDIKKINSNIECIGEIKNNEKATTWSIEGVIKSFKTTNAFTSNASIQIGEHSFGEWNQLIFEYISNNINFVQNRITQVTITKIYFKFLLKLLYIDNIKISKKAFSTDVLIRELCLKFAQQINLEKYIRNANPFELEYNPSNFFDMSKSLDSLYELIKGEKIEENSFCINVMSVNVMMLFLSEIEIIQLIFIKNKKTEEYENIVISLLHQIILTNKLNNKEVLTCLKIFYRNIYLNFDQSQNLVKQYHPIAQAVLRNIILPKMAIVEINKKSVEIIIFCLCHEHLVEELQKPIELKNTSKDFSQDNVTKMLEVIKKDKNLLQNQVHFIINFYKLKLETQPLPTDIQELYESILKV